MKQTIFRFITIITAFIFITGCGGGGGGSASNSNSVTTDRGTSLLPTEASTGTIMLSGTLKYERVPVQSSGIGLDYPNTVTDTIKLAKVEAIDSSGQVIASTVSTATGRYSMEVPNNTVLKLRVYAQMEQSGTPGWNVKVVDNTDGNAEYVLEGAYVRTAQGDETRDLTAPSGWDSTGNNISQRAAAPFAILDNIYAAMHKILLNAPSTVFPPLTVNWSVKNVPSNSFDPASGQIVTSLYTSGNLFILGAANLDTDEYDDHIITHEWGHYYEDKFSRADSIGGSHSDGDYLDIRVAFSEGFGNAFSAIALDEPLYFDSMGSGQSSGFSFNMENGPQVNPGWFSEGSVQRILYDLYDANDDGSDDLSLGFGPLHRVFTGAQKQTAAFTSIFSFITALKNENSTAAASIDEIVNAEQIAQVNDIYGENRTNLASETPYISLALPSGTVSTNTSYGSNHNNLSNHKYVKFTIDTAGNYTITMQDNNNTNPSDPDFELYQSTPSFKFIDGSLEATPRVESASFSLGAGDYLLDVSDWELTADANFTITIN